MAALHSECRKSRRVYSQSIHECLPVRLSVFWRLAATLAKETVASDDTGSHVTSRMRAQPARLMSDDEILDALRLVARTIGRIPFRLKSSREFADWIDAVRRRFGSWPAGVRRAELRMCNRCGEVHRRRVLREHIGTMDARRQAAAPCGTELPSFCRRP